MIDLKMKIVLATLVANIVGVIRPSPSLTLMDGEGFVSYLELNSKFGAVVKCVIKVQNQSEVELNLTSIEPIYGAHGEVIHPFSSTVCGIRVNNISSQSVGTWNLSAYNATKQNEHGLVSVRVIPKPKHLNETIVHRDIGTGTIKCSEHETYTRRCRILDSSGDSWSACEISTIMRPNDTYDCLTYNWGRMEEVRERIIVDSKNRSATASAKSHLEELDSSVVLRCQFTGKVNSCQAIAPEQKFEILVMDGLYNGRYSSYDTLTSASRCALEITKPLTVDEVGLWRLLNYESNPATGCLFYVGRSKKEIIDASLTTLTKVKEMKAYQTDTTLGEITFSVPFIIDDCYLRDSNRSIYFPDTIGFERSRLYGRCVFKNMPVIPGIWTCGIRGRDYDKEVLQNLKVITKPKEGEVYVPRTNVRKGESIQMMCSSAFNDPLTHCAFIDPSGKVHLVGTKHSIKAAGHLQYYGNGIAFGDCGATIDEITHEDFGEWRCHFVIDSSGRETVFRIHISDSGATHATPIGLGVGLTVVVVLMAGFFLATVYYKRRNTSEGTYINETPEARTREVLPMASITPRDSLAMERGSVASVGGNSGGVILRRPPMPLPTTPETTSTEPHFGSAETVQA